MSTKMDRLREELENRLEKMYMEKMPEAIMTGDINIIKPVEARVRALEEIKYLMDQIEGDI